MTSWYQKMFPSVELTPGRLDHRIKVLEQEVHTIIDDGDYGSFFNTEVNFDEVPDILASLNLNRSILLTPPDSYKPPDNVILTNEVLLELDHFRSKEGLSSPFITKWIKLLLNNPPISDSKIAYASSKSLKNIKKLKSSKSNHLKAFLLELVLKPEVESSEPVRNRKDTVYVDLEREFKKLKEKFVKLEEENRALSLERDMVLESRNEFRDNSSKLYSDIQVLTLNLEDKNKEITRLGAKINQLEQQEQNFKLSKSYKKNTLLNKEIQKLKIEIAAEKEEKQTLTLKNSKLETDKHKLDSQLFDLKAKLKSAQSSKSKFSKKNLKTKQELEKYQKQMHSALEFCNFDLNLREDGRGRKFSDNVRLTCLALNSDANVSAENCPKVIQLVAENIFDTKIDLKDLPKPSCILNIQSEGHVLSKNQVLEEIKDSKHFTYACDATSRDKQHYLEQHIVLDNGKHLSLGFCEMASDNSDTLLECCIDIFRELCDADMSDDPNQDESFTNVIEKLKCLLSDRAEVMKCFDKKFSDYKKDLLGTDVSTHFIFCNAHFLLGLFNATEKAVKDIEQEEVENGGKLGRDANSTFSGFQDASETAALRLIRLASSAFGPRGDEKSGSRFEWLAFCSRLGIKSQFSSFRFNNVFHNATALLLHKDDILKFLDGFASNSNMKLQSIVDDLNDDRIMSIISAISLFHMFFTEPYWCLMQSQKTHGSFPQYVRKMEKVLKMWVDESFMDVKSISSVFDDFDQVLPKDYMSLFNEFSLSKIKLNFQVIVRHCQIVFERQLKDFLDGGVFGGEIEDEVKTILDTCPLTNLTGERLFGDLDFDLKRRRNASLFSSSSKIMWKRNKTYHWLTKKITNNARRRLFMKAKKMGPEWKERKRQQQKEVLEQVKKRIAENRRRKLDKTNKAAEIKNEALTWVLSHGGLCTTKGQLDELMKSNNKLKQLQYQIKTRKLIYKESINSSGTVSVLYNRLLSHIENNDPMSTPSKKRRISDSTDSDG